MKRRFRKFAAIVDCELKLNHPLAPLTSMHVGGNAACVVTVHSEQALQELLVKAYKDKIPVFPLGCGSNTIFLDEGFDGIVLRLGWEFAQLKHISGVRYEVGAATMLKELVNVTVDNGHSGLENCVGIPGMVGGSLAGNSGTHGWGVCDRVSKVRGYFMDGEYYEMTEIPHGYRYSGLKGSVIVSASFILSKCDAGELMARKMQFASTRKSQPYGKASAGCIFKNPKGDSAGKLIDLVNLKGYSVGDFEISPQHANFIVNNGNGTSEDFLYLVSYIRQMIKGKYEIDLNLEIQIVSSKPKELKPKALETIEGQRQTSVVLRPAPSFPILNF